MKTYAKKVYVGCALTSAPEDFKKDIEEYKSALRVAGYEVFDFVGLVDGTPKDVYEWDIGHCVKDCDAFIGICDYPAIGLGYELCESIRLGKPVLALANESSKVTRVIAGIAEVEHNCQFIRYKNFKDALRASKRWLSNNS